MARRGKRRRLRRLILWVGLLLLIAGFIARRTFVPRALYYLTHRAPSPSQSMPSQSTTDLGATAQSPASPLSGASTERTAPSRPANPVPDQDLAGARLSPPQAAKAPAPPPSEKLTDADRQALDEILRRKSK